MLSGSTMTGSLILNADPTDDLGAATKQYVDSSIEIPAAPEISPSSLQILKHGQLWWDSSDGRLYIYYTDVDSSQWVPATPETENNVELNAGGGLEQDENGLAIKIRPGYGVATSSLGLQIMETTGPTFLVCRRNLNGR